MQHALPSIAILFLATIFCPVASAAPVLEPIETWSGKIDDKSLRTLAPKSGFVADVHTWKTVWMGWRPTEEMPEVDFSEQLILVGIVPGPNLVMVRPTLHENGDLRFIVAGTRAAGPGFGYRLVKINGKGIKTINGQPILRAEVGRPDTRFRLILEEEATIIDITSPFGIDKAVVKCLSDEWPESLVTRLHLTGLESFKVGNGEYEIEWSVSSTGDNATRVSMKTDHEERQLDPSSPYYTKVRIVGGNGKVPLKDGFFQVPLPAKLLEADPKEVTLRWVDFYRR